MNSEENPIYHERQRYQLCAVHAINNLLQRPQYDKKDLDLIASQLSDEKDFREKSLFRSLSPSNAYKGWLGLGDYDVSVLIKAFQSLDLEVVWFDLRKGVDKIDLDDPLFVGMIVNFQPESVLKKVSSALGLTSGRHWKAISKIQGSFYDLDSEYDSPKALGSNSDVKLFLKKLVDRSQAQILLINK
ncbi:Josephin-1 [Entomophthora muscae]|uniref:Josephin-1 n=1 Tax=Entomophthora muscae TaxID=34485 RepID=A0ACC2THQ9_9FUNG|nr:Josephin-1 [Entomophthora muscae]